MDFRKFDTFVFDLDGTIWIYPKLIAGAKRTIDRLYKRNKRVLFITNFNVLSRKGITAKLNQLGLAVKEEQIISSGFVIAEYLKDKKGRVLAFGRGVKLDLQVAGVKLVDKPPASYLVIGHDLNYNYEKMSLGLEAMQRGAQLLTPSYGLFFPTADGMKPGTAALLKPLEYMTGKRATVLGKPSQFMSKIVRQFVDKKSKTVLFGDELASDIIFGKRLRFTTVLVQTGVDKKAGRIKPDAVIKSVAKIKI